MKCMKKINLFIVTILLILLSGCSASEKVQGDWHAQNSNNENSLIQIKDKKLIVDDKAYNIKQQQMGISNGIKYYGYKLNEKQNIVIAFPNKKSDKQAILLLPKDIEHPLEGEVLYVMDKQKNPSYQGFVEDYLR